MPATLGSKTPVLLDAPRQIWKSFEGIYPQANWTFNLLAVSSAMPQASTSALIKHLFAVTLPWYRDGRDGRERSLSPSHAMPLPSARCPELREGCVTYAAQRIRNRRREIMTGIRHGAWSSLCARSNHQSDDQFKIAIKTFS